MYLIWFLTRFMTGRIHKFATPEWNILQAVCVALLPHLRKFIVAPEVVAAREDDFCKLRNWELRYGLGLSAASMSFFFRALFSSIVQRTNGSVSLSLQYVVQFLFLGNQLLKIRGTAPLNEMSAQASRPLFGGAERWARPRAVVS